VWDYWYPTTHGAFHLEGKTGRGIYRWPAPVIVNRDVTLTFSHDDQIGADEGWTYSVDGGEGGGQFFLFFSKYQIAYCGHVRWMILASYDNDFFFPFSCAD
jgi:hypothetical protein